MTPPDVLPELLVATVSSVHVQRGRHTPRPSIHFTWELLPGRGAGASQHGASGLLYLATSGWWVSSFPVNCLSGNGLITLSLRGTV